MIEAIVQTVLVGAMLALVLRPAPPARERYR